LDLFQEFQEQPFELLLASSHPTWRVAAPIIRVPASVAPAPTARQRAIALLTPHEASKREIGVIQATAWEVGASASKNCLHSEEYVLRHDCLEITLRLDAPLLVADDAHVEGIGQHPIQHLAVELPAESAT
jgi:hypothetical protein